LVYSGRNATDRGEPDAARAKAPGVTPRTLEVAMQSALIVETDACCDLRLGHPARKQPLGTAHAAMRDVRVRR
jgi:hypothetical protein